MKVVNRKIVQTAPSTAYCWHLLLVVAALLGGCGGRGLQGTDGAGAGASGEGGNTDVGGATASGGNAQGGGSAASGGQTDGAMAGGGVDLTWPGSGGIGNKPSTIGCLTFQGGSASSGEDGGVTDGEILASPDGSCNDVLIWEALRIYEGDSCSPRPMPEGLPSRGNVVLDSEGRVIDITEYGVSRTEAVEALACDRWPCLAGETIPYFCETSD
jgi:hypothetical protein